MTADPLVPLLGGAVQQRDIVDAPALVLHEITEPDFWIDPISARDLGSLANEIDPMLANGDAFTGLSQVRSSYGFTGAGQTVAVIDSGIAWDHVALGGGLGSSYRIVGGWDFAENDANPYDDGLYGSHGTHVSGIVGGDRSGTADDGVAPGVDFVGLRVFNDAGQGYFNWVENALRWVHQYRNAYENPITAVNLSLGTSWNSTTIPNWTTLEDEFAQLKADGIFVAVSAGNSFASYNTPGLSYPAASPHVVPVMSVDDTGSLSYFSQRQSRAIAAPGRNVMSSVPDYAGNHNGVADDYASMSGTSMASPYIAGASVLIRQAMQFVGYTNVSQDTIYNHMMSTATSFYDAATNQSYKRINLANAIDSLMPADDYGSTVATASDLGQLNGSSQLTGLIGKVHDADYFRFTAAGTGAITFSAGTSNGMAPVWSVSGGAGSVSGANGQTFAIQAVAGQTYTIGLSSSSGIGWYGLTVSAPSAASTFTYTDWGTITQLQSNNASIGGTKWYKLRASQTGYFTTEAMFASAGGNVDISLLDSSRQTVLANGAATSAGERADLWVTAGTDLYLRVTGANVDVDFRLTNLVSHVGATVTVSGTTGADSYWFDVGATQRSLSINGTGYSFAKSAAAAINLDGGGGNDSITIAGSAKKETASMQYGYATLAGIGINVVAVGMEYVTVSGGGGNDVVTLYDSAGNDSLGVHSGYAAMTGSGYSLVASGFKNASSYSYAGSDTAHMYDTAGNDTYRAYVDRVEMKGANFVNSAVGFETTVGHASAGVDKAYLYDSSGNDVYSTYAGYAAMTGSGFNNAASGFDTTYGYASYGYDVAYMHDSAGDDLYRSYSNKAIMSGYGYTNYAYLFDACYGYSSTGNDTARQYGSRGADEYFANAFQARMSGDGFGSLAAGFEKYEARGLRGLDRAWVDISALATASAGSAWEEYSTPPAVTNKKRGFDKATVSSLATDEADVDLDALDLLFSELKSLS